MVETLVWWLLVELVGLAVLPVAFRFFRHLPGRGYAFCKPLGLLLVAYPFWLLTSFGFLTNTQGGIALVALLVAALSWGLLGRASTPRFRAQLLQAHTAPEVLDTPEARSVPETVSAPEPEPIAPHESKRQGRKGRRKIPAAPPANAPETVLRENDAPRSVVATTAPEALDRPKVADGDGSATLAPESDNLRDGQLRTVEESEVPVSPLEWMRAHLRFVIATELVFTVAFVAWTIFRAYNPEITATEKPMEFAFLNGILQSKKFPPLDPWLSGYAISYYYFGYVIIAMLTMLSGIAPSIAFNLAIALLFGLAATGAFGLTYELIVSWRQGSPGGAMKEVASSSLRAILFALFSPLLLLIAGNFEGLFESLHSAGVGSPEFWNWLDIKGLVDAPTNGSLVPTDNWWWWRASRVIHDVVHGQTQEVIDEFPQFSFLLGDMHPHVLALPFVLLILAVAFNLLRNLRTGKDGFTYGTRFSFPLAAFDFALITLVVGSLPFLNFWDILPYGFIMVAAFGIARYRSEQRWDKQATRDIVVFTVAFGILTFLLYLPFFIGFQSQAGGILPVLSVKTRLHQYLIMFGLFVFVFLAFLARLGWERRAELRRGLLSHAEPALAFVVLFPAAVGAFVLVLLTVSPALQDQARQAFPSGGSNILATVIGAYFAPLFADPWLYILLALVLTTIYVLLRLHVVDLASMDTSVIFVLLLLLTGFLLSFGVEFVYLRDVFGTRMNTVFKFYFATWVLFAVAAGFAIYYLWHSLRVVPRAAWVAGFGVLLAAALVYPVNAIPNKANDFTGAPTLDGIAWIRQYSPSDYAGIEWLKANAPSGSTIVESTGRQYTFDDRMSMATGLPTVLGWIGHEEQWRGGNKLYKNDAAGIDRAADVEKIYKTLDPQETLTLLNKYAINFVIVGQTERQNYTLSPAQVDKFSKVLSLVFQNSDLRIYGRLYASPQ